MSNERASGSVFAEIESSERIDELSQLVRQCLFQSVDSEVLGLGPLLERLAGSLGLSKDDADTPLGNVFEALEVAAPTPEQVRLITMLLARSLSVLPPRGVDAQDDVAGKLIWLAAHGVFDVFPLIDQAMGSEADALWGAVADFVARYRAPGSKVQRAEALVAASALGVSQNPIAKARAQELCVGWADPAFVRLLAGGASSGATGEEVGGESLDGYLGRAPSGVIRTALSLLTGWRLLAHVSRLVGKWAFKYQTPTSLRVTHRGVEIASKTKLLGRVVRESTVVIPYQGLAVARREVRFPRLGTYAGVVAGLFGAFIGFYWFLGGLHGSSVTMSVLGLVTIVAGVLLDFVLTSLLPARRGACSVVFVPKKGRATCVTGVDQASADRFLKRLAT